jgi:DNA-binding CsgD family transcriptional regulator
MTSREQPRETAATSDGRVRREAVNQAAHGADLGHEAQPTLEALTGELPSLEDAENEVVARLARLAQLAISSGQRRRADRLMAAARILRSPLPAEARGHPPLTKRQVEVAFLIAGGLTNRQIAHHLEISERTVHSHVQNILKKLMLTSRTQIAVWTARQQQEDDPGNAGLRG